jgi:hypothetical protein
VRYDVLAAISILPYGPWRRVGRYKINWLHLSSGQDRANGSSAVSSNIQRAMSPRTQVGCCASYCFPSLFHSHLCLIISFPAF